MSSDGSLNAKLSEKISPLHLKVWVIIGISVGVFIILILGLLSLWTMFRRRARRGADKFPISQIPNTSKEIPVDRVAGQSASHNLPDLEGSLPIQEKSHDKNSEKILVRLGTSKSTDADNISQCSSVYVLDKAGSSQSGDDGSWGNGHFRKKSSSYTSASPLVGLPEFSHLGWGHWFTLRDLEYVTNRFSKENVIGEGGYGIVYRGKLINGMEVAVKKLLNNL